MSEVTGWFADVPDDDDVPVEPYRWQPVIQTEGLCLGLDVWFETEQACVQFIQTALVGRGILPN